MNLYCIMFPNEKRYFGIETIEGSRWRSHKCSAKAGSNLPVHKAIRKYGPDNCTVYYIAKGLGRDQACAMEIEHIATYGTTNYENGYNVSPGGDHWIPNEETREKISSNLKAYFATMTPEERRQAAAHLAELNRGKVQSPERAEKSREAIRKAHASENWNTPEMRAAAAERKRQWWADRKAKGLTNNIAYSVHPENRPEPKPDPRAGLPKGQHRVPPSEEHRRKIADKKRAWWAAKKAAGLTTWESIVGKPKQAGYKVKPFSEEHKVRLSAAAKRRYQATPP